MPHLTPEDCPLMSSGEMRRLISLRTDEHGRKKPVTYQTLKSWRDRGYLPFKCIGNRFFYVRSYVYHLFGITESHADMVTFQEISAIKEKARTQIELKNKGTLERFRNKQKVEQIAREKAEELEAIQAEMAARGERYEP